MEVGGRVNITMVTFNRVAFTQRSIESIEPTAGHPYSLTVVDNGSSDGTVDLLQALKSRRLVHTLILNATNRGVAYGANQGWAAGTKRHYVKVDNDIVFTRKGWLRDLVQACDRLPSVGAVGYNFEARSYPLETINGVPVRLTDGNVGGAAVMLPERVHALVGYWCEDYFPYGEEDLDMHARLRLLGLRSYYMSDEEVGLHLPEGRASPLLDSGRRSLYDEEDSEYRAAKDRWRATYGGDSGLRSVNEWLYAHNLRPLYIEHGQRFRPGLYARMRLLAHYKSMPSWQ
jgi:glycosyltransferase involved in cell wall biosynthesis